MQDPTREARTEGAPPLLMAWGGAPASREAQESAFGLWLVAGVSLLLWTAVAALLTA